MKFCPECGIGLKIESKYCDNCGTNLLELLSNNTQPSLKRFFFHEYASQDNASEKEKSI